MVNLGFVLNVIEDPAERVEAVLDAWHHTRRVLLVSTLIAGQEAYDDVLTYGDGVITRRDTFQKFFEPAEIQALLEDTLHIEAVPVGLGIYLDFRDTAELHDFLASRARRFIDWESLSRKLGLLRAIKAKRDPYDTHRELLDDFWESVLVLGRMPRDEEFDRLSEVRQACGSLPRALQLFIDRFGEPTFAAARLRRKEDTFHYYRDFDKDPLPELLTRIKIDLKRLFVTVIDHTNGREHQLLFFKERFLPKDHPERPKMDRFSSKLRKLGLHEETIGYGPSKEKWEAWNRER